MQTYAIRTTGCAVMLAALLIALGVAGSGATEGGQARIEAALSNITTLHRPGQDGLATIWDGNKYVQCRRMADQALRCEAAGALMQPSLGRILSPERVARLSALGWHLDPSFGNYVQSFPAGLATRAIAEKIRQALREGYDADLTKLETQTDWIKSTPCPPRNGPSQNLAGIINDHPAMAATAVYGCAYKPPPDRETLVRTKAELIAIYGPRATGEIQRLRINLERQVFSCWIPAAAMSSARRRRRRRRSIARPSRPKAGRCWRAF